MKEIKKIKSLVNSYKKDYFFEYYNQLPMKDRQKLMALLKQLQEVNLLIAQRQSWVRYCSKGLYELRCYIDHGISHCVYFFVTDKNLILTHAYLKKGPKEAKQQKLIAERLRKEWLEKNVD